MPVRENYIAGWQVYSSEKYWHARFMGIWMMLPEPISVTILVTQVFEKLNIPYLIGGSIASTIYGMVRTTQDVDMVVDMQLQHIQPFINALRSDFFLDEEMISSSIREKSSFNIIHRTTMFKVDVFIQNKSPFQQSELTRARKQVILVDPEVSAYFASPEDTILAKLEWFRRGGEVSERQWRDVIGILKVSAGILDLEYLRKWAAELNVVDLLEKALRESP
jgi:type IV secretory pathway TrbF-like protein